MTIKTRIDKLFSRIKWPGWFAIIVAVIVGLPDWEGRIQFWLDTAKAMPGYIGYAATIAASPWFLRALFVGGVFYVILVGEAERPMRHPILPILGWAVFGFIILAFLAVLEAGYVSMHVPSVALQNLSRSNEQVKTQLGSVETELAQIQQEIQQTRPRIFSDDQRQKLAAALNKVPPGKTYSLIVEVVPSCNECSGYANDLMTAWNNLAGWKLQGTTNFGLNPRLIGAIVGVDAKECSPDETKLISDALDRAGINHSFAPVPTNIGVPHSFCSLFIGSKPPN